MAHTRATTQQEKSDDRNDHMMVLYDEFLLCCKVDKISHTCASSGPKQFGELIGLDYDVKIVVNENVK